MRKKLVRVAQAYIVIIEKIEETQDPEELKRLEEKRIKLHWKFIDLLRTEGIPFNDREDATRLALRFAKGEL